MDELGVDNLSPSVSSAEKPALKIAIIHDWLVTLAGAEKVLAELLVLFPNADIFSIVDFLEGEQRDLVAGKTVYTSFIQKLPFARKKYRNYLPLMPIAVEQFDLSSYDLVISSSHAVAKGVLTGPDQLHICLCYSPIRYAWDLQHQYLRETGNDSGMKGMLARYLLHKIRLWDVRTSNGVDSFVAISGYISRRIWKVYRRESTVIYPPVGLDDFPLNSGSRDDYYVTASRMVPYKRIDLIVRTFVERLPHKRLLVIGDGPEFDKIKKIAAGATNVELLGYQSFSELVGYLQNAKAFIFAAEEDFGIAPLEAQACGTPVIAYKKGGAAETILGCGSDKPTGVLFDEQSVEALSHAVETFEGYAKNIFPENCRANAERFSVEVFRRGFSDFVSSEYQKWCENRSL